MFAVNTDGTGFRTLHSFSALSSTNTNIDGIFPGSGLILAGNTLYDTADRGGGSGNRTVFSLSLGSVSAPQLTVIPSGVSRLAGSIA